MRGVVKATPKKKRSQKEKEEKKKRPLFGLK